MVDLATLAIKIDSTEVKSGVGELDSLTAAGAKAEKSIGSVAGAATKTAAALHGVTVSAGAQRAGMQQLSYQIGDVSQQFALGTAPMTIFAQQGGQVVQALSLMRGGAGGLIGFLAGPWGTALLGATIILGSLWSAHSKAADGSKEQKEAAEDLTKAIDQPHNSTIRATQSTYASAQASLSDAFAKQQQASETRKAALAELELAKAKATSANASAGAGGPAYFTTARVGAAAAAEATVRSIDGEIVRLNADIGKTTATIRGLQGQITSGLIAEQFDKNAAATGRFNRTMDKLNSELRKTGDIDAFASGVRNARTVLEAEEAALKKSNNGHKKRKETISDAQRAYEQAFKSTDRYIEGLELEIQKIGKTPVQLRALEIARMKEAAATDTQRQNIEELSAAREAALAKEAAAKALTARDDYDRKTLQPLRDELALLGLTGVALIDKAQQQKLSALSTGEEAFKADLLAKGLTDVNALWLDYYTTNQALINGGSILARDKIAAEDFAEAMRELQSIAGEIDFGAAFGSAGDALNGMVDSMARLSAGQSEYARAIKAAGGDQIKIASATSAKKKLEVNETFALIGATKSLFKEQSTGYQILGAAEKAYAAVQAVNTIKNVAAGASKMFSSLGPFAFPVVAAMLAVMAGLGFSGGGGSSSVPSAQDLQDAAGTGSVLGDGDAKSNSITAALDIMASNSNRDLEYSNQMVRSLRAIENNIGSLASLLAKQLGLSGGSFDQSGLGLGSSSKGPGNLLTGALLALSPAIGLFGVILSQIPILGDIVGAVGKFVFSTKVTRTLVDQGLTFNAATVAQIAANGITGNTYQEVETAKKKKLFGISLGTKTSTSTTTGELDNDLERQVGLLVGSLRNGIVEAAGILGIEGAGAALDAFTVNIGKISVKDLTGSEIQEQLEAVFSKLGDDMARAAIPGIEAFQKVGEGLFETLARLARDYLTVDIALRSIGKTFGAVGAASVAAREELIDLFGSLDEFAEQTSFFRENFLSEAEQIAPIVSALQEEFARLGLSGIDTREQFKAAVIGLDLTTTAGRELYAALLNIAPAFDKVATYAETANKALIAGFNSTIEQFTKFAESLRKYRATLFQNDLQGANAYAAARAAFVTTATLASGGNANALGSLEGVSRTFLDAARNNASTSQQYLRDVAAVARAVDSGIFAAEETADYAQLQLDALNNSVLLLANIDAGIQAIVNPTVGAPAGIAPPAAPDANTADMLAEIRALRADSQAQSTKITEQNATLLRLWTRFDGDGLLVRTDADTPLNVVTS